MEHIDGEDICPGCIEEYYEECADCGELVLHDEMYQVIDENGDEVNVCRYCHDRHYETCEHCGKDVHEKISFGAMLIIRKKLGSMPLCWREKVRLRRLPQSVGRYERELLTVKANVDRLMGYDRSDADIEAERQGGR